MTKSVGSRCILPRTERMASFCRLKRMSASTDAQSTRLFSSETLHFLKRFSHSSLVYLLMDIFRFATKGSPFLRA